MINDAVRGYFGFERLPFDRSIPAGALFASASHQEAVGRIGYGVDTRQITVITGEVGAGKSVAARAAAARRTSLDQLITIPDSSGPWRPRHSPRGRARPGGAPRVHHATLLIPRPPGTWPPSSPSEAWWPVLLIDEAHLLSHDQLEAIRMLTSAQSDPASPLAVLLLGQPNRRASMRLGVLAALDQRIGVRYAMAPMTPAETGAYLQHHTKLGLPRRHPFQRRCRRTDPPGQPRLPPRGQPAVGSRPARHLHHTQDHRRHHRHPRRHHRGKRPMTPHTRRPGLGDALRPFMLPASPATPPPPS